VLDLIEGKRTGILAILDEELRMPRGGDDSFRDKMMTANKKNDMCDVRSLC
jgi:myosin heavy subunit